jgi:hypothetical protein
MRHLAFQESSDQDIISYYLMKKIKNIKLTNHKKLGKKTRIVINLAVTFEQKIRKGRLIFFYLVVECAKLDLFLGLIVVKMSIIMMVV